jgi:4-hydroxybenzoate polyprenyltransferase
VAVTRREAALALAVAAALLVAGLVWLFGPYGLLLSGAALAAVTLFVFDIREESGAKPVADPAWPSFLKR